MELNEPIDAIMDASNGFTSLVFGLTLDILKMALGFWLEMNPRSCQDIPPVRDGQPKNIDPPKPSLNGTSPVKNTTT